MLELGHDPLKVLEPHHGPLLDGGRSTKPTGDLLARGWSGVDHEVAGVPVPSDELEVRVPCQPVDQFGHGDPARGEVVHTDSEGHPPG